MYFQVLGLGWNPTFSFFYMFIESSYRPPLYSCINDVDLGTDAIVYYQEVLDGFEICNISLKKGSELYNKPILDYQKKL